MLASLARLQRAEAHCFMVRDRHYPLVRLPRHYLVNRHLASLAARGQARRFAQKRARPLR